MKSAGRTFQLKELEDLCAKFLKYRLDSSNLIAFLRNTYKYDAPDIRDVVISRFGREANAVMSNDQVIAICLSIFLKKAVSTCFIIYNSSMQYI